MDKLHRDTGKTFEQWVELARKRAPKSEKDLKAWLQKEHELPSMTAWSIANTARAEDSTDYEDPEPLVDALYSGPKAALRPLHEKVVDVALALGDDALVTACKTMVPMYRKHVFAELRPVDDAVEVRLALGESVKPVGRLERTPRLQPGDRRTHRVLLRKPADIDAEFRGWLTQAYEAGAGKIARAADAKMPPDFQKSLDASAPAVATWETCTPAMRRDFIQSIDSAKQAETRARRITVSVEKLASGKKRAY